MGIKNYFARSTSSTAKRHSAIDSSSKKEIQTNAVRQPLTQLNNRSTIHVAPQSPSTPLSTHRSPQRDAGRVPGNSIPTTPKSVSARYVSPKGYATTATRRSIGRPIDLSPRKSLIASPAPSIRTPSSAKTNLSSRTDPGPFYFLERVNEGSFGSAWAARDAATGRVLCLKVTPKTLIKRNDGHRNAIMREIEAYQRISVCGESPHVMQLHAVFQDDLDIFFAMDLMDGDLWSSIPLNSGHPVSLVRKWMAQVATGLNALHNMGIIHRDVKPENILLSPAGDARISDLGSAFTHRDSRLVPGETYTNDLIFTPGYAAPEIVGAEDYGKSWAAPPGDHVWTMYGISVDWWALGCVFFMLTHGFMLFPEKKDMAAYVRWYDRRRGQDWLLDRTLEVMPESEHRVLYGLLRVTPSSRFTFEELQTEPYFRLESGGTEFMALEQRAHSVVQSLYRPERPRYKLMNTSKKKPYDLIKTTDDAEKGNSADWVFYKWFAWHNRQGMWNGWQGEKRWWAF
ncbi:kinase-like protein [Auriscalpium vulgare]|uniref:Kinase-like protein n=1 Tax=Auriscalpium vulgare TaxID=40419 RepID=A0ACB8S987_9AGAM|nr:kinase-like protein [Auriscalpium vulgare]